MDSVFKDAAGGRLYFSFFQPDSRASFVHLAVPSSSPATHFIIEYNLSPSPPLLLPNRTELDLSFLVLIFFMKLLMEMTNPSSQNVFFPDAGLWLP